ncbi:MAG: hypothetical protein JO314_05000 [Acidobacteria bacterium]|nr:hypothetical protein [Acidobacteriota bacterium]
MNVKGFKICAISVNLLLYLVVISSWHDAGVDAQTTSQQTERFDSIVREDFFAGMFGDTARLDKGMKYCEAVLAKDPKHAEALVWHGGGMLARSAISYRNGDSTAGKLQWEQGLDEMNEAVKYAPDDIGVKIGRSATLIGLAQSGWNSQDAQARELLRSALDDYEFVYRSQEKEFSDVDLHSRGELLFGLASGWSILGDHEKTRQYLELIKIWCKGSRYDTEARQWLVGKPRVVTHDCTGCHISR